ncbi:glycine--tRNA ligase subunit alpha [Candidatus Legionella polyplacis]|uniref:Glycine--tRNA ligase alpha subunit n=1 Tax=Candidatus Legionella polyplacis TaxID=2005262 RepID=A0ABZ2GX36_9GAMM
MSSKVTFQDIFIKLQEFWVNSGCLLLQPLDMEVGAGTFHPASFFRTIGPEPWFVSYFQPSRRPLDGRYGNSFNRLQYYCQFQVIIKPSPDNVQEMYFDSLKYLNIDLSINDIQFIEDNWESPTLGACGVGWEVRQNGLEISQFTYFQQMGGLVCDPISVELTYGLERISMLILDVDNVFDIPWTKTKQGEVINYREIYYQNEVEMSLYNFKLVDIDNLLKNFEFCQNEADRLISIGLIIPAYEMVIKASHFFNLLEARRIFSINERQDYIFKIRKLSTLIAGIYFVQRKNLGFPLKK